MVGVASSVDHKYAEPPDAVSVAKPPSQKLPSPVISGTGNAWEATAYDAVLLQPYSLLTVTTYVPGVFTVISGVCS